MADMVQGWVQQKPTGMLLTRTGMVITGKGIGAYGHATGEVCFNTAMTGYQEIITDPSYAGQIVVFTFPHIGNVGTNDDDNESAGPQGHAASDDTTSGRATGGQATGDTASGQATGDATSSHAIRGIIIRQDITDPANHRSLLHLDNWLKAHNIIGLCGIDTRALTAFIREQGMFDAAIAHQPDGQFKQAELAEALDKTPSLKGLDLAREVTTDRIYEWTQECWQPQTGFGAHDTAMNANGNGNTGTNIDADVNAGASASASANAKTKTNTDTNTVKLAGKHIIAVDFGIKHNILRCLATTGCRITVVPATTSADDILAYDADGILLSNGPGDPAATGTYAIPQIRQLIASGKPVFGICLGHQMLALALGAKTEKMPQGHHGANHPVQDLATKKVEIATMNHGFTVARDSLPDNVEETHISLFDGTNCGIRLKNRPVFSVQYHPEASPGPQDSQYLFHQFISMMTDMMTHAAQPAAKA